MAGALGRLQLEMLTKIASHEYQITADHMLYSIYIGMRWNGQVVEVWRADDNEAKRIRALAERGLLEWWQEPGNRDDGLLGPALSGYWEVEKRNLQAHVDDMRGPYLLIPGQPPSKTDWGRPSYYAALHVGSPIIEGLQRLWDDFKELQSQHKGLASITKRFRAYKIKSDHVEVRAEDSGWESYRPNAPELRLFDDSMEGEDGIRQSWYVGNLYGEELLSGRGFTAVTMTLLRDGLARVQVDRTDARARAPFVPANVPMWRLLLLPRLPDDPDEEDEGDEAQ